MRILVTGGAGFLGKEIARQLLARGDIVRVLDVQPSPNADVESVVGSITDEATVTRACNGVDAVIHTASVVSQELGQPQHLYDVNVTGTQTLLTACQSQGVRRFVYTSSIDVVFDGTPISNGDERLPYPTKHLDYYGTTKMLAEQAIVAANEQRNLTTGVIRAAGLYGPGDKHRFPQVLDSLLSGQFVRIGNGSSQFTHCYVGNTAHAHLQLLDALEPDAVCAGQVYFVTDHGPSNFFDFFDPYVKALGLPYREIVIPCWLAHTVANGLEWRYDTWKRDAHKKVTLSKYAVASLCADFWFNHEKATRDFGYQPIVTQEEAFQQTIRWLEEDWLPKQRIKNR